MTIESQFFFFTGMAYNTVTVFKPNISSMVLYEPDSRRDGGFTIFYIVCPFAPFSTYLRTVGELDGIMVSVLPVSV